MAERYIVQPGDCINSIAYERGFFPDTLWNHADNKSLKEQRKDMNVLLPGDLVSIPDKRMKEVSKPAEKLHQFKRKGVPKFLQVRLSELDKPLANRPFKIRIDGEETEAKTDGDGWLKHPIPPNAKEAVVTLSGTEYTFDLGHLDPVKTASGLQGRLMALGFLEGPAEDVTEEKTKRALKSFQRANGLKASGEPDDATWSKLKSLTGA